MRCPNCGFNHQEDLNFCSNCGTKLESQASTPTVGPGASDVEYYLTETAATVYESGDTALKVSELYGAAFDLELSEVVSQCLVYSEGYDELLRRLVLLECPQECSKLRQYTIDALIHSKQELTEFAVAFSTGDSEPLFEAENDHNEAQRALALAAGERDRLMEEYLEP